MKLLIYIKRIGHYPCCGLFAFCMFSFWTAKKQQHTYNSWTTKVYTNIA